MSYEGFWSLRFCSAKLTLKSLKDWILEITLYAISFQLLFHIKLVTYHNFNNYPDILIQSNFSTNRHEKLCNNEFWHNLIVKFGLFANMPIN